MRVAVTGGSGFVGRKLLEALSAAGHESVCIARGTHPAPIEATRIVRASVSDAASLSEAFSGCEAVAHLAGINRSTAGQTFEQVHEEGTRNVVEAARAAGVRKVVLLSFLKARPGSGSRYHETKWAAEKIIADSGLEHSILKAGVIFGPGDAMVGNLRRTLRLLPVFATVGLREATVRPVWVGDVVSVIVASAVHGRLKNQTVPVVGPRELPLSDAVRLVAKTMGRPLLVVPLPVWFQYGLAWMGERLMRNPIVTVAQARMLAEGISDPLPGCDELPDDLRPGTPFDRETILKSIGGPSQSPT